MSRPVLALTCLALGFALGWLSQAETPAERVLRNAPDLITLRSLFEEGELRARNQLENTFTASGTPWSEVVEELTPAVVRIRLHFEQDGASRSTEHATGLLFGDRTVLTAGHVVDRDLAGTELEVLLSDGTRHAASVSASNYVKYGDRTEDWAVLELQTPVADVPEVELGAVEEGSLVVVLGFPGRFGHAPDGEIRLDPIDPLVARSPLAVLARVSDPTRMRLELIAGAEPIGGISGAPVLDLEGRLVGLQTGVTQFVRNGISRPVLDASPIVEELRKALPGTR